METSRIKPDYNTLLQSLTQENLDKNVNVPRETPDLLENPNLNSSKNTTKDGVQANERFMQLFKQLKDSEKLEQSGTKELFSKFDEDIDFDKLRELLDKYGQEEEKQHTHRHVHQHQHQSSGKQQQQQQQQHQTVLHRGPHHSMVLDPDVKEKIVVEPPYLHPAVPGQEISYHDNVLGDKDKKKDFWTTADGEKKEKCVADRISNEVGIRRMRPFLFSHVC